MLFRSDTGEILDGQDGECARDVGEIGEAQRRTEESSSTGRVIT